MRIIKVLWAPFLSILLGILFHQSVQDYRIAVMISITIWMALWWITEVVPMAITSLIPVFAYPFTGLMSTQETASLYMNDVLFLFVGGFILSFAMEKWHLHKRIALNIVLRVGVNENKILLGLMLCSFLLSMWISNTATTMMLMPTTMALIDRFGKFKTMQSDNMAKGLLLGIAYAASVGGSATLVGSPTNMIFLGFYEKEYVHLSSVSFFQWFVLAFPITLILFGLVYFVLTKKFFKKNSHEKTSNHAPLIKEELSRLGAIGFEEKCVAAVFGLLVLLWFTRADLPLGFILIKGWSGWFAHPDFIKDGAIAVLLASILFLIPAKKEDGFIMDWEPVKKLPYSVILLFGGGFALAKGFSASGLTAWLATQLYFLKDIPPFLVLLIACILVTLISEIASNMATIQLALPILAAIASATDIHPLILLFPATLVASYAFMLPVGTAPNTIIFGSEKLKVRDMVSTGFILNIAGVTIVTVVSYLVLHYFY